MVAKEDNWKLYYTELFEQEFPLLRTGTMDNWKRQHDNAFGLN